MANMTFGVNIIPKANANVTLGNSDYPWTVVSPNITDEATATADAMYGMLTSLDGNGHNGVYRGKNLGTLTSANIDSFCTAHEISTGKFTDLYLGDYFVIQDGTYNATWMIAGFDLDYNKKKNDSAWVQDHHITIIPKGAGVVKARMHSTDTTSGGIANSEIFTTLSTIGTALQGVLSTHMGSQFVSYASGADADGAPTGITSGVAVAPLLLNETEVWGAFSSLEADETIAAAGMKKKLPVFNFISQVTLDGEWWMENIQTSTKFKCTRWNGTGTTSATASTANTYYVRPKVAIK